MIYELRIYRCVPGHKPALLSRFENETLRIWEKHGIRQAARPSRRCSYASGFANWSIG
jgi:hypothetical protein